MKKLNLLFIFLIIFSLVCLNNIKADTYYVTASALRIRKEATTNSESLIKIYNGESIMVTQKTTINGNGCDDTWYQVNYNDIIGFVCSSFLKEGKISTNYNTSNYTARVYASSLSVRKSASSSSTKIASLINGTNVTILETLSSGNGCDDAWLKVNYHDNKIGYICSGYVIRKEDVTGSDSEYEKELLNLGFPASYHPYLVYLHQKHPSWQFKAIKTNLKWKDVVSGESGKNYIQDTTYDAYRTSSTPQEGSSWFEATDGVNAFYLDPRNFLTEKYIFMFENLQYDEKTQTANIVKSIFGSSYLSDDKYVNYFIEAGKANSVSPVHLASRVVQEGGSKSDYAAVSGTSTLTYRGNSLVGYYNYYNIGAYKDSYTSSPVTRGLAYAAGLIGDGTSYGRPWTTREKAIHGGAQFIGSGYISKGQYTLYFEKFNTSPTASSSPYTHQYMTNVHAPVSEGSNNYYSYKENEILDNAFAFAIPIYEDMPQSVSLPQIGDVVNSLSSVLINGKSIGEFDPDVVSYTHYISKEINSITINATPTSTASTIEGNGTFEIDSNSTTFTIKVTSQTGNTKVYSINIIQVDETQTIEEIFSNLSVKIQETYLSNISENTIIKDLFANIKKYGPSTSIIIKNSQGDIINQNEKLATGQKIQITTTSNDIKELEIVVKGDSSGDGEITILDLLQVQKHILNSKKISGAHKLAGDTSSDGEITILDLLQIQKHILGDKKL